MSKKPVEAPPPPSLEGFPYWALLPIGTTAAGSVLAGSRGSPAVDAARGGLKGLGLGLGAVGGWEAGRQLGANDTLAKLFGAGIGGAGGLLGTSWLLRQVGLDRRSPDEEEAKQASDLKSLMKAKTESDRGNYLTKAQILRRMIQRRPQDFFIDSRQGDIVGLTHPRTGFRIHLPEYQLPVPVDDRTKVQQSMSKLAYVLDGKI